MGQIEQVEGKIFNQSTTIGKFQITAQRAWNNIVSMRGMRHAVSRSKAVANA